jgi:uncharacterized DUF497 family protein
MGLEPRFDPIKDKSDIVKHGISLARAFDMDIDQTVSFPDDRFVYGEDRFIAIGPIGSGLHVLAYTIRDETIRPISLRKADRSERKAYRESW